MDTKFLIRKNAICAAYSLLMATATAFPASATAGNDLCGKRQVITQQLLQKYKESTVGLGVTSQGRLIEVLTTVDGTTWSIIMTTPEGVTCLVASGESWRTKPTSASGPML